MAEGPRRRLRLLSTLMIVAQLVQVQIVDPRFPEGIERRIVMADSPRGVIRDRNGHLMAGNAVMYSIEAAPVYVVDAQAAAAKVNCSVLY